jgi:GGDEF domain-containing protein
MVIKTISLGQGTAFAMRVPVATYPHSCGPQSKERAEVSLQNNTVLNLYSIAILLVIYFHALKFFEKDSLSDKLYMVMLNITVLLLGIDILSRFDGKTSIIYPIFNQFGNFMSFLMSPVLPSLWVAYVHYQIYGDERKTKRLFYPLSAINILNAVVLILSQFFGWYYYIDSNNIYHRGPLFWLPTSIVVMLIAGAFFITAVNRRKLGRSSYLSLIFFAVPPIVGIVLQVAFYGISIVLNSVVLSLMVVFVNLQNHSAYTDYLTGVSNRKNVVGDNALENTANLLKSCIRNSDFIARYGGDEFCIVLDISDKSDLEAIVGRIYSSVEKHNKSGLYPYELDFSMGYAVYDQHLFKSSEEFLKYLDVLMYEHKQSLKSKLNAAMQEKTS